MRQRIMRNKNSKMKHQHRWWMKPIIENRAAQGDYENLLNEMRLTDVDSYFNYFRMTPDIFEQLLAIVGPSITKVPLTREAFPPGLRLAVTLRYLATGDSFTSLAFAYRIEYSTIHVIIPQTCSVLWDRLSSIVFFKNSEEAWIDVAKEFGQQWHFPYCLGAIDRKHIYMQGNNIVRSL